MFLSASLLEVDFVTKVTEGRVMGHTVMYMPFILIWLQMFQIGLSAVFEGLKMQFNEMKGD